MQGGDFFSRGIPFFFRFLILFLEPVHAEGVFAVEVVQVGFHFLSFVTPCPFVVEQFTFVLFIIRYQRAFPFDVLEFLAERPNFRFIAFDDCRIGSFAVQFLVL